MSIMNGGLGVKRFTGIGNLATWDVFARLDWQLKSTLIRP